MPIVRRLQDILAQQGFAENRLSLFIQFLTHPSQAG
jgi:hypothetical protein